VTYISLFATLQCAVFPRYLLLEIIGLRGMDEELTLLGNHLNRDQFHGNSFILYKGKVIGFVSRFLKSYTLQS